MGGWLGWMLLGGLFLFLMFRMSRGGGCCGGHGDDGNHGALEKPGEKGKDSAGNDGRSARSCH